jgi:hypothetical protein
MADLRESLGDNILSGLCNTLSLASNVGQLGANFYSSAGAAGIGGAGQQLAQGFGAAADIVCGREPRDLSSEFPPPFQGGQCIGAPYNVSWRATTAFGTFEGTDAAVGPVASESTLDGTTFRGFITSLVGQPGEQTQQAFAQNLGNPPDTSNLSFGITGVVRTDGQPDNCGNPPPEPPAYDPSNFSPTLMIDYDDNAGNPQSFNLPVVYGPGELDVGGNFVVPVELNFSPTVNIDGSIKLNTGDLNINSGPSGGPQEIPETEPVPDGSSLVGVRVVVTQDSASDSPATEVLGNGSTEPIWLPRLAAVRFEYTTNGIVGWGPSRFCQTLDSVVWAERPAASVDVVLEQNVVATVTKIVLSPAVFFNGEQQ